MYITITGIEYYMGIESIRINDRFELIKDINNSYDDEAIKVCKDNGTTYGYVANSVETVARGCFSAGRIYDQIKDNTTCEVMFIIGNKAIAKIV